MRARIMVVAAGAVLAAACSEFSMPAGPASPWFEIVDGRDASGNQAFFWLPPIVLGSSDGGANLPGLKPEVRIFECIEGNCFALGSEAIASFTTLTGPGSETVRDGGDHYLVNWHTDAGLGDGAVPGGTYRICVSLEGLNLGHADVFVGSNGKEVKNARTNDNVPLVDGSTLPIKFRIEKGFDTYPSDGGCPGGAPATSATLQGAVTLDGSPVVPSDPFSSPVIVTLWDSDGDRAGFYPVTLGFYEFPNRDPGEYTVCAPVLGTLPDQPPTVACPDGSLGYAVTLVAGSTIIQDFTFTTPTPQ